MSDKNNDIFLESNLDALWRSVREYRTSANFMAVMKACKRFRHLAPFNAMLVEMQRPGAKYVLSENEWRRKYDRGIKPNARPVIVLVPFGPVDFLFEISDTYPLEVSLFPKSDEEILEEIAAPYKTEREVSDDMLSLLANRLAYNGIAIDNSLIAGADFAAKIQLLEDNSHSVDLKLSNKTWTRWRADYLISVNKNAQNGERFASICHELGHLLCHHLIAPKSWNKWPTRNLSHAAEEFEAESVSWLICERLGIGNPSEKYLSNYIEENKEIPKETSIENILSAAKEVWKLCSQDTPYGYRDGLLFKNREDFKNHVSSIRK